MSNVYEAVGEAAEVSRNTPMLHIWERYCDELAIEYQQCVEEGLDVEKYKPLFDAIIAMPTSEIKREFADTLFKLIINTPVKEGYKYTEPSELEKIKSLRDGFVPQADAVMPDDEALREKVRGAWYGRICGCLAGTTVEGMRTNELVPMLKETDNYPMKHYIRRDDMTEEIFSKYSFPLKYRGYADKITEMYPDDDTNYMVLYMNILNRYGRDFKPIDVAAMWLGSQPKDAYCTAERVAFINFIKGYLPPQSAIYENPYREWIGAQIRGDYFGYINPGDMETAAEYAWRDASISHIKNGIYGEMFSSAMIAAAAVYDDMTDIIKCGLAQLPKTSRLYEHVNLVIDMYHSGAKEEDVYAKIHEMYDEYTAHGWCHTIANAMIVAASLLYGNGEYGPSICKAIQTGFDTDCNGATVGSVIGMRYGYENVPDEWKSVINGRLRTTIIGADSTINIEDAVDTTMKMIKTK